MAAAHNNLGNVFREQGRLDEAIACHQRALELRPNLAVAHNSLGMAYRARGSWTRRCRAFEKPSGYSRISPKPITISGQHMQEERRLDDAVLCYRRAIELEPGHANAYNDLGAVLTALRQTGEAVACVSAALRLNPHFPEAHCNLGVANEADRRVRGLESSLREALRLDPGHIRARAGLSGLSARRRSR